MKKVLLFFSLMLAIAAQADVLGEYSFEGTLGDKIPVRLKFAVNGEEIALFILQGKSTFAGFLVERGLVVACALSVESDEWQGR